MDRRRNPFAPGAGLQPPALVGRDPLLEAVEADFHRLIDGRSPRGVMLLGLRGVGKTVLLNRIHDMSTALRMQTAMVESPETGTLPTLLAPELRRVLYALDLIKAAGGGMSRAVGAFRNFVGTFKVAVGDVEFGLEPARGFADSGDLEQDLADLVIAIGEAAQERGTAIGVFIDEVQYLSKSELAAVLVTAHRIAQRALPVMFVFAGLPQIAALAGNAKSYAERLFEYPEVGPLEPEAARDALARPAEESGAHFSDAALDRCLEITERYPYFLQEWGFHVWNEAQSPEFDLALVERVSPKVVEHLDRNFFRVRFDRLTALQQKYLRAMAELGAGPHRTGDIAEALGVTPQQIAPTRRALVDKGMVWSQRMGETAFTVPLFDEFVRRRMPELERHVPTRRR